MRYKFQYWHLAIAIFVVWFLFSQGYVSQLMSALGMGPDFTWEYYCVDQEKHQCVLDSPNSVFSKYFEFNSSMPYQDKTGTWLVNGTLNGVRTVLKGGDEIIANENFKIKVDKIWIGMVGEEIWGDFKITYSFYIDESQISAEFEDSFPLVRFKEQHKETILITNKILDFDGGFLVNKKQETFYTQMEGWMEHSKEGIPLGLSTASLTFPVWDLGDNQYQVIPYINFSSSKTYTDPDCDEDCPILTMTTLPNKYITSPSSARKETRTLVGKEENISIITIQRNKWMDQFPSLYYEETPIRQLNIAQYVDTGHVDTGKGSTQLSYVGGIIILIILALAVVSVWYYFRRRKK